MQALRDKRIGTGVVALVAVAATAYLVDRAGERPVDAREAEDLSRRTAVNSDAMQQQLADAVAGKVTSAEQERMDTPLGLALARVCAEWTDLHDNLPTAEHAANHDAACARWRHYVATGAELPAD